MCSLNFSVENILAYLYKKIKLFWQKYYIYVNKIIFANNYILNLPIILEKIKKSRYFLESTYFENNTFSDLYCLMMYPSTIAI